MTSSLKKTLSLGAAFLAGVAATTMLGANATQPADPMDAGMPADLPPGMDPEGMARWMEFMTPGSEHAQMAADATGDWVVTSQYWTDPDGPAQESIFNASVRPVLGGRFCVEHMSGDVMGMPFEGMGVVGYDNHKDMWVSIWMDNMSTSIYYSEGKEQPDGRVVMYGEFYDPMNNIEGRQRITLDASDPENPKMTMEHQIDGDWQTAMVMTRKRSSGHADGHGDHDSRGHDNDHDGGHSR